MRGVYDVKNHPKYLNGEATEEDLYIKFLQKFETNGLNGKNEKDSVGDGKVLTILIFFYTIRIHSSNRIHNSLSSPLPINKFRTTANNVTSLPNLDFVSNFLTFINSTLNHYQYLNAQIRFILFYHFSV